MNTPTSYARITRDGSVRTGFDSFNIGPASVGIGYPVYVIAEAGVNHDGDISVARELIHAAVDAEADAVKFQVFSAERLAAESAPAAAYQQKTAGATSQREMLARLELSHDDFAELFAYAGQMGIEFIATPFSAVDLEFLLSLGVRAIKIASPDLVNPFLMDLAAASGLPVIASTGAADLAEVDWAVERFTNMDGGPLALLHCISSYPAHEFEANLGAIGALARTFDCIAGFSDHTESLEIGAYATTAGACIIEKHLTLDRRRKGPDHAFSLEPEQMGQYIRNIRRAELLLGRGQIGMTGSQREVRDVARSSLVVARNIREGQIITREMLTARRPGTGIPAMRIDEVVGRRAVRDLAQDTFLDWSDLAESTRAPIRLDDLHVSR